MNEILKKNGLPTEGSVDITVNLIKLIAEQYSKEKVKEVELMWKVDKASLKGIMSIAKRSEERIKELEKLLECEWCMKQITDEAVHCSCAIRHGELQ